MKKRKNEDDINFVKSLERIVKLLERLPERIAEELRKEGLLNKDKRKKIKKKM